MASPPLSTDGLALVELPSLQEVAIRSERANVLGILCDILQVNCVPEVDCQTEEEGAHVPALWTHNVTVHRAILYESRWSFIGPNVKCNVLSTSFANSTYTSYSTKLQYSQIDASGKVSRTEIHKNTTGTHLFQDLTSRPNVIW